MRKEEINKEKAIDEDPLWVKPDQGKTIINRNDGDNQSLYELSQLEDYEVADEDPDVRGWKVYLPSDQVVGKVDDLIVDPQQMKVRYLVVEFENIPEVGNRKKILIPIGQAALDENVDKIYLPKVHQKNIVDSLEYKGEINREYELLLRKTLSDPSEYQERPMSDFYEHNDFDDKIFYGNRRTHQSQVENSKFNRF